MKDRSVFFDLETGGLDPLRHPVIQFAGIALEEGYNEVESLEVKIIVDPSKCSPEALEMNSYNPKEWENSGKTPREAVRLIGAFLQKHATVPMVSKKGKPWKSCQLAGHNAVTFDRPFLGELFKQQGEFCAAGFLVLDTLQLAMWWFHGMDADLRPENYTLTTLCAFLGIPLEGAHDALADVRATVALAQRITEMTFKP